MTELERRLQALGADAFPATPDVRSAVVAKIAREGVELGGRAPRSGDARGEERPRPSASRALPRATRSGEERPRPSASRALPRAMRGGDARGEERPRSSASRAMRGGDARGEERPRSSAGGAWLRSPRRRVYALALAFVLVPAAAVAAVPDARHAVLDWLGLAHVRVERVPRVPPLPALHRADLGQRVASAAEAGRRAGFAVSVPASLGTPDAVYVSEGEIVSLAYGPRPGLPRDPQTGLGMLVTELRATGIPEYVAKMAGPRTVVEPVRVGGAHGVFVSGEPHELLIEQPGRVVRPLPARLAGNALAFERGDLVLRLEGRFGRDGALAIARSLRTSGG
jgi:hypothetical protein